MGVPSISVTHATGSYDVHVASGLIAEAAGRIDSLLPGRRLALVTDPDIRTALTGNGLWPAIDATLIEVPPGERAKSRDEWSRVTDQLLALGLGRDTALVALGGGSIGDLTGFVAATYLRGIPFVQIPTTLLAMVDASVGGKVAIDTPAGKNLVGAFHPPALVIADPGMLATLPDRIYREGLAEAVKHGLVADKEYFDWIAEHSAGLLRREPELLTHLVQRSVEIKAAVVSRDEREQGERAILNAGHTVAHALEQLSNYTLPHGEAVAIGLVAECRIAERMKLAEPGLADLVAGVLTELGLPTQSAVRSTQSELFAAMSTDKKNRGGRVRMALPTGIGRMAGGGEGWTVAVPRDLLQDG